MIPYFPSETTLGLEGTKRWYEFPWVTVLSKSILSVYVQSKNGTCCPVTLLILPVWMFSKEILIPILIFKYIIVFKYIYFLCNKIYIFNFLISNIDIFYRFTSECVSYFEPSMLFLMRDCSFMIFFLWVIIK